MIRDIDAEHDDKLLKLEQLIAEKAAHPINPGNKKVIIFTAFADTANYLYEHLSEFSERELGLGVAEVTGTGAGKTTVQGVRGDLSEILTCFSPVSKERDKVYPRLVGKDIDILIATDCISEGQNLQDADFLVNYDIHWNPVRIVQRFGRVDRIGSKNDVIQLVNFWPDEDLDNYINLKARVENRMHAVVMSSTGDDDYINEDEQGDLEYRRGCSDISRICLSSSSTIALAARGEQRVPWTYSTVWLSCPVNSAERVTL
ncbi:C-terminal helicase domain-containing protein [uncultured Enorma sp.]|uniref:C-terminal helicase domain-containing protein n=1 Tax=uncultured Enorma sp. TaxID=1714346 RepID=UPI002804CB15|nr:C-terminal helicase domain-containing protein [uncultured Enorma sp.]